MELQVNVYGSSRKYRWPFYENLLSLWTGQQLPMPGDHIHLANLMAYATSTALSPFLNLSTPTFGASGNADDVIPFLDSENLLSAFT